MPELLSCSPKDTDFIEVKEYLASTPAEFSLEDSPVLYLTTDGTLGGMAMGPARLWIASSGLYFWPAASRKGFLVRLNEINLHAIQTEPPSLYLQIQGEHDYDFSELRFAPQVPVSRVYEAVSGCLETFLPLQAEYAESGSLGGSEIDGAAGLPDLRGGQGDDEIYYNYDDESAAAANVEVGGDGRLGKSRRRSDSFDSNRNRKLPRE